MLFYFPNLPNNAVSPKNNVTGNIPTTVQPIDLPRSQANSPSGCDGGGHGIPSANSPNARIPIIIAMAAIINDMKNPIVTIQLVRVWSVI